MNPRISLWKEDVLSALVFVLAMYGAPLLAFSLERAP
jgi:hypothetical protein